MKTSGFRPKNILITVKAYPVPSLSYGETVCCAGVDIETGDWIRLYPVPFRDLVPPQRFAKYDVIRANCAKATDDHRPESFRIQTASIEITDHLNKKDKWRKRKEIVMSAPRMELCEILWSQEESGISFGLIKPRAINFESERRSPKNQAKAEKAYSRPTLFDRQKEQIENIPFQFYYRFYCMDNEDCPGHRLPITDWEINQAYRVWRFRYPDPDVLLEKIKVKWLDITNPITKDAFLFVGNLHRFRNQFVVLGVFSPPI